MQVKITTRSHKNLLEAIQSEEILTNDVFIHIANKSLPEGESPMDAPEIPGGTAIIVYFDDVHQTGISGEAITPEDGRKICEFVKTSLSGKENMELHISCHAGQSRSTATAEALRKLIEMIGHKVDIIHTSKSINPNRKVFDTLVKEGTPIFKRNA